jgi:hypothetical protein
MLLCHCRHRDATANNIIYHWQQQNLELPFNRKLVNNHRPLESNLVSEIKSQLKRENAYAIILQEIDCI